MATALTRTTLCLTLVAALALTQLAAPRPAQASDLGKILGAAAAAYVTYQVLDGIGRSSPPPPRPAYRHYNPPPARYSGGEARYWYDGGYSDGFKDGNAHGQRQGFDRGYRVGHRDGERSGYNRGVRTGYRIGYGDGYDDGHYDGFITGTRHPYRR